MRKIWDIHGGVHPPENKIQSNQKPIGVMPLPDWVSLPLNQHVGAPARPLVKVGDHVKTAQLIADAEGFVSAPVHASLSGKVVAIENRPIPHASGMQAPCIVIESDGEDTWTELQPCENYMDLQAEILLEKVRSAGIAGLGGAGFPTAVKLQPDANKKIDTLILNGTECEPYITADDVLMREQANDIIAGAQLMAKLLDNPRILIGVEDNKPEAIKALTDAAQNTAIEIISFPTKYPSGGEKQLIQILTGKEVKSGTLPSEIGIVLQNVGTAVAAFQAIKDGIPLIERVTTVVGRSLQIQRNVHVRLGTPIQHLLSQHGFDENNCARIIIGGPMMGYTVDSISVPVIKTTNCVLVPSEDEMPTPPPTQPCIRCGHCADACPANLLPQQLYWYSQAQDFEKLQAHHLMDCIECGACSYVCPSAIPLVQYYRASKGAIRQQQIDKQKSDRARLRFEAHKERVEKAEAEKEAKRAARKKAAEEARKKIDLTKSQPAEKSDTAKLDPVAAAMAKAANTKADPADEKAKIERNLESARNRLARFNHQLNDARNENDEARAGKLEPKIKQTELKISELENKLAQMAKT